MKNFENEKDENNFDWESEIDYFFLKRDDKKTLQQFNEGKFSDIQMSSYSPVEDIIDYGLENKLLTEIFSSFPDPRKMYEVP